MKKKEFSDKFEEYLILFTDKLIEDINVRGEFDFHEETTKIFHFLCEGHLGKLSDEKKLELFLENYEIVSNQFFRLVSEIENKKII